MTSSLGTMIPPKLYSRMVSKRGFYTFCKQQQPQQQQEEKTQLDGIQVNIMQWG